MNPGLGLVALLYVILPLLQAVVYIVTTAAQGLGGFDPLYSANYLLSILSYHWMLANVLLSLKIPVVQNLLPYDQRVRIHVYATTGVCFFLLWHAVHTITLNFGGVDLVSWALIPLFLLLVVLSVLWVPVPGLRRWALGRAYDVFKGSHKVLFLVLAAVSWWHISEKFNIVDPSQATSMPVWSAWLYQGLFALTALTWAATRVREAWFLPVLTVRSVEHRGGIARLTLEPHPGLHYHGGQFAFLRFMVPGLNREEHPFSFTSRPGEPVGFAIRELGDGTKRLRSLRPGDRVRVNAGFGSFSPIHRGHPGRPLVLIGSGIGVAPLVSILKDLAENEADRDVLFLQATTTRDEQLEPETIDRLMKVMPRLTVRTYVFDENGTLYNEALFRREITNADHCEVFLCSSPRVRSHVVPALRALGIPPRRIHFEAFHLG